MPSTISLPQHHEDLVGPGHPAEQQAAGPPEGAREEIAGDPAREAEDRDEDRHGPRHYRLRRGAPDALRGRWRYRLATTRTRQAHRVTKPGAPSPTARLDDMETKRG